MRIIAGKHKGRTLFPPKNEARPTLDRTKETLFNILQFDIEGSSVLDLFAGSGALGLEAFSRGCDKVVFVDNDSDSIAAIKRNCANVYCNGDIIKADFANALRQIRQKFDIVFLDPPYAADYYVVAMQLLTQFKLLNEDAIVVCEHALEEKLPEIINGKLAIYRTKNIGKVGLTFYKYGGEK